MTDLQEAFRESARREFAMVPDEAELDYTFSPGFRRKMQRIIRAQVHGYWNMVNTLGKRIAIAAVIIVMLLTTAMAIKPIRERVIKFFVEVYEEYFSVTFGEDKKGDLYATPDQMIRYTLSWVPEGYVETKFIEREILLSTIWSNNEGTHILLGQGEGTQETTLDHIGNNIVEFEYGSVEIYQLTMEERNTFVWAQDNYIFQLLVPDSIPIDSALQMIDSLTKIE